MGLGFQDVGRRVKGQGVRVVYEWFGTRGEFRVLHSGETKEHLTMGPSCLCVCFFTAPERILTPRPKRGCSMDIMSLWGSMSSLPKSTMKISAVTLKEDRLPHYLRESMRDYSLLGGRGAVTSGRGLLGILFLVMDQILPDPVWMAEILHRLIYPKP